jgi:hypothetical protein
MTCPGCGKKIITLTSAKNMVLYATIKIEAIAGHTYLFSLNIDNTHGFNISSLFSAQTCKLEIVYKI